MTEELSFGQMVGEYRIERKLDQGGMGSVYAAQHPVIGKRAAIKVLFKEHCERANLVQRFIDEARAVNHIRHEHIVDIFSFGELSDGRSYFVMEWLDGESLASRIARGRLRFTDALEILGQLCDALRATHSKGIVHRDLKPANVFLVRDASGGVFVKLLDFGIAKLTFREETSAKISGQQTVMGTPEYIAPEQALGYETSAPADVYALGVLAFEMFAGRPPFSGQTAMELMLKHASEKPPELSEVWPLAPPILDQLISRMLGKKPEARPTLAEVSSAFAEVRGAFLLAATAPWGALTTGSAWRPVLARPYSSLPLLLRPLLTELSSGGCWIEAQGTPPAAGTPVVVRFTIDRLSLAIDIGAVIGAALGTNVLLRYDALQERQLDAIFAVASTIPREGAENAANEPAVWRPPEQIRNVYYDISADDGGNAPLTSTPDHPTMVTRDRALKTAPLLASVAAVDVRSPDTAPLPKVSVRPQVIQQRRGAGLGARVLALSLLVTVAAVVSVTAIAMQRTRIDREFYLQDLNLRTSRALADSLGARLDRWQDALLGAAAERRSAWVEGFDHLVICSYKGCRARAGGELPPDLLESLNALTPRKRLYLQPLNATQVLLIARGTDGLVAASVKREALLGNEAIAPDLQLAVLDERGQVLVARPQQLGPLMSSLSITAEFLSGAPGGARELVAPDGTKLLGAWSEVGGLGVFSVVPRRVSDEALEVLTRQVIGVAAIVLAVAALAALIFARTTTRRLRALTKNAAQVASGDFADPPEIGGGDEVAQLARSFGVMTRALRDRDAEVIRAQRAMSDEESRALHRQMAAWLESDLASKLTRIQGEVEGTRLEELVEQAASSLRYALLFGTVSSRRVDLANTAEESVQYAKQALGARPVFLTFTAPNAVLFPRIEARESELRELIQRLIVWAANQVDRGTIDVALALKGSKLELTIAAPFAADDARRALAEVKPLIEGNRGEAKIDGSSITLSFATGLAEEAPRP